MAQVVEIPELQPWFLVRWPSTTHPEVLMEFETQDEAEGALRAAFAEIAVGDGQQLDVFPMTVSPALTMLEEPQLRDALARWDVQLVELESRTRSTMDDLFPKRASRTRSSNSPSSPGARRMRSRAASAARPAC